MIMYSCLRFQSTQTQYLAQIEVCLNKDFSVTDCEKPLSSVARQGYGSPRPTNNQVELQPCTDTTPIVYPVIQHG